MYLRKRTSYCIFAALLLILGPTSGLFAKNAKKVEAPSTKITNSSQVDAATHDINNVGLTVTNQGQIGVGLSSTQFPGLPSCIYPYPKQLEYLFGGCLWIGAEVAGDTLVSVGCDGWQMIIEMWPTNGAIEPNPMSDQGFIATFTDTVTDIAIVNPDPNDNRPHIPLNLEITNRTYAWNHPYAENFIIMDYQIENIGDAALNNTWFGLYVDGDVLPSGSNTGYMDDICGFIRAVPSTDCSTWQDTINLAWIGDNNGLNEDQYCPYTNISLTSVTGISLLANPIYESNINFNWWFSNGNASLDWGPRQQGTAEDPFYDFGVLGTPVGDAAKYYIMSHPEIDYDQIFTAVDNTSSGWLSPPSPPGRAEDYADGYDTRYLYSFGPATIPPGEIFHFVVAYVGGENFHTECGTFETLFDPYNPKSYYDYLNFDPVADAAVKAAYVYDNPGVDTDGDGYAGQYYLCGADTIYYNGDGVPDFAIPETYEPTCGDVNGDNNLNLMDPILILRFLFFNGPNPVDMDKADVNGDGEVDLRDILTLIFHIYFNRPAELNCP